MADPLPPADIEAALADLPGWSFADDKIGKRFSFGNFKQAMAFIVRVGFEAEEAAHHPELFNVYSTVEIKLNTHDAGGKVTQKDLGLAVKIESLD